MTKKILTILIGITLIFTAYRGGEFYGFDKGFKEGQYSGMDLEFKEDWFDKGYKAGVESGTVDGYLDGYLKGLDINIQGRTRCAQ